MCIVWPLSIHSSVVKFSSSSSSVTFGYFLCKKFLQGLFSSSKPYIQSYMDGQQQKEKKDDDDDGPQGK